ncbi:site-specific DNA-methyltransferase (plasmid) [Pontibacillus sp. ALD_SL1]|uniref:DNA-methyltransferase n=1 Tax=Pontibacillus sp. ALD_SL1 TaxID=2777185 RepID=UPI001A9612F9|nr:site-specific DNA-methyltransferase [Pontibacillus sp. ALD_SL1]QST02442.1 site-specific DNA-methyltransferase [Pontibacillus sp. ALD_SL1]
MFSTQFFDSIHAYNQHIIRFVEVSDEKKSCYKTVRYTPEVIEKMKLKDRLKELASSVNDEITIANVVKRYMELTGGLGILSVIYEVVEYFYNKKNLKAPKRPSIRGILIDHEEEHGRKKTKFFKRIKNGLYVLLGIEAGANVVNGDGRNLSILEDETVDAIITDHPWSDKKAHKAGNQSNFNDSYEDEMFAYNEEDFKEKFRVLTQGGYLVEMLPFFLHSNIRYLMNVIRLAFDAGFHFYSEILWVWDREDKARINTGRTTKRAMKLFVFTKGKAKRLSPKGKPYMTNGNLDQIVFHEKSKKKVHQSEKPVSVYQYLIEKLTRAGDVVLDQYAGSGNILDAAKTIGRHAIGIEYNAEFAGKIGERHGIKPVRYGNHSA